MSKKKKPRILIYDIEASPIIGYTWGIWQQNVVEVIDDWQILSVAWKWHGEKKIHCVGQDDFPNWEPGVNNDVSVVRQIHKLFDEADIVVAHNGNRFDQKKCNARMMVHGLKPPSPYKQVDTMLVAKRYGAFTSNRLKSLAEDLKVQQKGNAGGFETWKGCLKGDKKAWKTMKQYNRDDIPPLEDLYVKFLPWITNHPNVARLLDESEGCPKCGSKKLQSRGYRVTNVTKYRRAQCQDCGGWCSFRMAERKETDDKPKYVNFNA